MESVEHLVTRIYGMAKERIGPTGRRSDEDDSSGSVVFVPLSAPPQPEARQPWPISEMIRQFARRCSLWRAVQPVEQLRVSAPIDRLFGWLTTIVITAVAFGLRWWNLARPGEPMFDETIYAKDSYSLLRYGYEGIWAVDGGVDPLVTGDTTALLPNGSFVMYPPVGKWLIGLGEWLFGLNPFGWRFASLVFGSLLVFLVVRLGRRLSRSTMVGGLAGLFIAFDGLSFVMSRIAMLEIFETCFIVAGVAAVVADRDHFRNKLADGLEVVDSKPGRSVFRPWLIVAGVMFGLAVGTKWDAVYPLAVFAVLTVVWTVRSRHIAGRTTKWARITDQVQLLASMVVLPVVVYVGTWAGWLSTSDGYGRQWGLEHPGDWVVRHFGQGLGSLGHYTIDIYNWQTGAVMSAAQPSYDSNPWGWPVLARTIGFHWRTNLLVDSFGSDPLPPRLPDCPSGEICLQVVTGLGTPLLWWGAALALLIGVFRSLVAGDWRFLVTCLATASTWLPWILVHHGPVFAHYALPMIPFMSIGLAMLLNPAKTGPGRRTMLVVAYAFLVVANFVFNYPILTGQTLTADAYLWRIWFPGWS